MGAVISSEPSDELDIGRQTKAIYRQGNSVIQQFKSCSDLVRLQLFRSYCSNLYGSHLWANYNPKILDKLRVAYNNIFRSLMKIGCRDSITASFLLCGVNSFPVLYRKLIYSFYQRLLKSQNLLIKTIIYSVYFVYKSALYRQWIKFLHVGSR